MESQNQIIPGFLFLAPSNYLANCKPNTIYRHASTLRAVASEPSSEPHKSKAVPKSAPKSSKARLPESAQDSFVKPKQESNKVKPKKESTKPQAAPATAKVFISNPIGSADPYGSADAATLETTILVKDQVEKEFPMQNTPKLLEHDPEAGTKFGFIAIMGQSNTGKSTLLNRLIGQKVAIVTPKVQTTRCRILGIMTHEKSQMVFQDTPGIFEANTRLDRAMVSSAWNSGSDADIITLVIDAHMFYRDGPERVDKTLISIVEALHKRKARGFLTPFVVVLNKMDLLSKGEIVAVKDQVKELIQGLNDGEDVIFEISALNGDNVPQLVNHLAERMPEGPFLYPDDVPTDMPMRSMAAEVTREALFMRVHQEVPYSVAVDTDRFKEREDGSFAIHQNIIVEQESQKKIVVGKDGAMIKKIGTLARAEMGKMFDTKVHLFLDVIVRKDWKKSKKFYDVWGLSYDA